MGLEQPTSDIKLPEELANAINHARENLGILESKGVILANTNKGLTKNNTDLVKHIEYLEGNVKTLTEEEAKLVKSIADLRTEEEQLNSKNGLLKKEIETKTAESIEREKQLNERADKLAKEESALQEKQEAHSKEKNALAQEKTEFDAKVSKLKNFISNI